MKENITLGEAIVYSSFLIGFVYFAIKLFFNKHKGNQ